MASEILLLEARVLYNLMNQAQGVDQRPVHSLKNFLLVVDARKNKMFEEQHIRGAVKPKDGTVYPPTVDVAAVKHCIVYDTQTTTILPDTEAYTIAQDLARYRSDPVHILKGGISRFAKEYLFLIDEKILYTPREADEVRLCPLDMYDYLLYCGTSHDALSKDVTYDLTLRAVVVLQTKKEAEIQASPLITPGNFLRQEIPSSESDSCRHFFESVSKFIDSYVKQNLRVMIASERGCVTTGVFAMAYLIFKKFSLKDAFQHVQSCDPQCRPARPALQDLSWWEEQCHGECLTPLVLPW